MDEKKDNVLDFFYQLWNFATEKHNQGVYNTVCLVVLLALPLLVLLTSLVVCCHCCCCRRANGCCCCGETKTTTRSDVRKKKKNKKNSVETEDLWITVKSGPMTPDRVALAMV